MARTIDDVDQYSYKYKESVPKYAFDMSKPKKKFRCPQCGQRTLVKYIDLTTGDYLPDEFGICDREEKCGYHCVPKASDFGDSELFISSTKIKDIYKIDDDRIPNCIPYHYFIDSLGGYNKNNFTRFLFKHFDHNLVWQILLRYKIGTTNDPWQGSTIFWQIDKYGKIRTGKIMDYDAKTCKRVKEKYTDHYGEEKVGNHIAWIHTQEATDYVLKQVLFGEFLINETVNTYHLVESEKTAILCSLKNPKNIYLATGGLQNLREDVMKSLIDKKIVAHPDKGKGYETWRKKIEKNLPEYNIKLSDFLEKQDSVKEGEDLADYIIKELGHKDK